MCCLRAVKCLFLCACTSVFICVQFEYRLHRLQLLLSCVLCLSLARTCIASLDASYACIVEFTVLLLFRTVVQARVGVQLVRAVVDVSPNAWGRSETQIAVGSQI